MRVISGDEIPYTDLARKLFDSTGNQKLVPFLGAGISAVALSARAEPKVAFPDENRVEQIADQLGLTGQARNFLTCAIAMACVMAADPTPTGEGQNVVDALKKKGYPPSVSELTSAFAELSMYNSIREAAVRVEKQWPTGWKAVARAELVTVLQDLTRVAGLSAALDSLSNISGYYESRSGREALWEALHAIFKKKQNIMPAHALLANVAKNYLSCPDSISDYLIVSANYDCLMEKALDELDVPFAAVTMLRSDGKIHVRFCDKLKSLENRNPPRYANLFTLQRRDPLVLLYKIHGCLFEGYSASEDSVVISDDDYVQYLSRMADINGVVPGAVKSIMSSKPFLFLGYSLNDWNVRSIFQKMTETRGNDFAVKDYSVTFRLSRFEEVYCERRNIDVLATDLTSFVHGIEAKRPQAS